MPQTNEVSQSTYRARIAKVQEAMKEFGLGAVVLEPGPATLYLTGVRWGRSERTFAVVLTEKGEPVYVLPGFEEMRARELIHVGPVPISSRMGTKVCQALQCERELHGNGTSARAEPVREPVSGIGTTESLKKSGGPVPSAWGRHESLTTCCERAVTGGDGLTESHGARDEPRDDHDQG